MFRQLLRLKKRQVMVLWLLVIVFVLPFILFFHAGSLSPSYGPGGAAGEIFGRKVPWEVFQEELRLATQQLRAAFGELPDGFEEVLRQQTWDWLILKEEAQRTQRVSDEDVAAALRRQPQFQQDGQFVPELYFQYVQAVGSSPQAFEAHLRDDLRIRKLIEQVSAEVQLGEEELRSAYADSHTPVDEAEFATDREAFRDVVFTKKRQDDLGAWLDVLRGKARLKSFLDRVPE